MRKVIFQKLKNYIEEDPFGTSIGENGTLLALQDGLSLRLDRERNAIYLGDDSEEFLVITENSAFLHMLETVFENSIRERLKL